MKSEASPLAWGDAGRCCAGWIPSQGGVFRHAALLSGSSSVPSACHLSCCCYANPVMYLWVLSRDFKWHLIWLRDPFCETWGTLAWRQNVDALCTDRRQKLLYHHHRALQQPYWPGTSVIARKRNKHTNKWEEALTVHSQLLTELAQSRCKPSPVPSS